MLQVDPSRPMPAVIYLYPRWWKEGSGNISGLLLCSSEGDQAKDLFGRLIFQVQESTIKGR